MISTQNVRTEEITFPEKTVFRFTLELQLWSVWDLSVRLIRANAPKKYLFTSPKGNYYVEICFTQLHCDNHFCNVLLGASQRKQKRKRKNGTSLLSLRS